MCYCCQKLENLNIFKSASNVQLSDWLILYIWGRFSIHLRPIPYIWGRFSIHLRPICTFEADYLYIWGRDNLFSHVMSLSQSENSICTFEADLDRPQMYSTESASNVQRIGLKCTESASNVQRIGLKCTYIEADWTLPGEGVRSLGQSRWFHSRSHSLTRASNVWTGRGSAISREISEAGPRIGHALAQ